MIRSKRVNGYSDNAVLSEFYGLSTDTKPTENVATGSVFLEVDTGATFLYDEESEDWTEVESGSGGGGGGDSDFSTAEVTLINSAENSFPYRIVLAYYDDDGIHVDYIEVSYGDSPVLNVPLYKGKCAIAVIVMNTDFNIMPSTSGNVTISVGEDTSSLVITGDGSFTAAGIIPG